MKETDTANERKVFCQKLKQELPGFDKPPFPGELGEKIYQGISKQAFSLWIKQQTILINEHQLKMSDAKSRDFLFKEMEKFLFEG